MDSHKIFLRTVTDVYRFIHEIREFDCDIDALYERQVVDAKSFLGLLSISHNALIVKINSRDENTLKTFSDICKEYEIEG